MQVELNSPCKVNFILNILGKRADGFHELETVMQPVPFFDRLSFERARDGIELNCDNPELPTGSANLVYRAAEAFLTKARISDGARIRLTKRIPLAAGLGGGSANAATTLLGLNQLFGAPLTFVELDLLARELGSDVPFFLQNKPAIAVGRGEQVTPVEAFQSLAGFHILLIHPGFGISTAWAYNNLAPFPAALNGQAGRAQRFVEDLQVSVERALPDFYNSLEAPVLRKFPLLAIFQEHLRECGATVALMSGSGSTTFALIENEAKAADIQTRFISKFGSFCWIASVPL
ncbi:MAG TPA: 4-(cytidine 5'-diphospho)-2-C-methyl-D-erythritol kinase [Verrucomicrobiae bacterium]|jgi:4-diphosphocytidyl-2-C-methyl-D-erythritol kinase|nr:4-(cytidine 5'-diphospho)-2-C-methyl-D-erythritol kinase [Verrucomicrobiae bacterium]